MLRIRFKVKAWYGYHVNCGRLSVFQDWPYIVSNVITRLSYYAVNTSCMVIMLNVDVLLFFRTGHILF